MSRIFWDTNLFVYLWEDYGVLTKKTERLRSRMLARGDQLLTSTLTLGEVLVKPRRQGKHELCRKYEQTLAASALLLPLDMAAARIYSDLRCDPTLKAPDAIQLACAAGASVDLFVTNDRRLQGKQVAGIQFIVALDQVPI
jgi:predicted nucleic acid-binding protein